MNVLKKELKRGEGEITLVPESLDDLWHLKYIIEKGDLVFSDTYRRFEGATDKIRPEKREKKPVRLGIRVKEVEFHKFSNRLRIHGVIECGIDLGSYHTLNIERNMELSIIKSWKKDQLDRIEGAVKASSYPSMLILTIEEGEACCGRIHQYGVEELFTVKGSSSDRREFFSEIYSELKRNEVEIIIVAGPGFTKEDFVSFLKEKNSQIVEKITMENTSSIGISGFQEVLRRGAVDRIVEETRISKEVVLMEKLLKEISKDGKAVYGYSEVERALNYGAISELLICDETLREKRDEMDPLLRLVEDSGGKVFVFSSEFEPGKKLRALGGIAAILRFNI
ncbi:MAG: mRNA surveillance protein pelota [Candidatus Syntropharchaeia archaeon]